MNGRMILTISLYHIQARGKNSLPNKVMFCGDLGWLFLHKEERGHTKSYTGASRNVPDEVTVRNIYLVARAR